MDLQKGIRFKIVTKTYDDGRVRYVPMAKCGLWGLLGVWRNIIYDTPYLGNDYGYPIKADAEEAIRRCWREINPAPEPKCISTEEEEVMLRCWRELNPAPESKRISAEKE